MPKPRDPLSDAVMGRSPAQEFTYQDMRRRTGTVGDPNKAAIQDRINEGAFIASMIPGALHPLALPMFAGAAAGWEGTKALGLNQYLPGPLGSSESTSAASWENILAALYGFTSKSPWSPDQGQ